jgi:hypothetical protein
MKTRPFEGMIQINHNNAIREKSKKKSIPSNELDQEIIELIRKKDNEKNELSHTANLVKDYVNELKKEMKNNYDDDNGNKKEPSISLEQFDLKKRPVNSSMYLLYFNNPKKNENSNHLNFGKRRRFSEMNHKNELSDKMLINSFNNKKSCKNIKRHQFNLNNDENKNSPINNLKVKRLSDAYNKKEIINKIPVSLLDKKKSHQNINRYKINKINDDNNILGFQRLNSPSSISSNQKKTHQKLKLFLVNNDNNNTYYNN